MQLHASHRRSGIRRRAVRGNMQSRRYLPFLLVLLAATATGCIQVRESSPSPTTSEDAFPVLTRLDVRSTRLTDSLVRSENSTVTRPGKEFSSFTTDEEIIFFVALWWETPEDQRRFQPTWKWYTDGRFFSSYEGSMQTGHAPYHVWGTHGAFSLGTGNHRVELWVGHERLAAVEFNITEP